jgi:hypothetical protein
MTNNNCLTSRNVIHGNADKNERTIIYVPTEGLLPITEAGCGIKK